MATSPILTSGTNALDADLYGAEQQGLDAENIASTGNLNIGNVLQYDDHLRRHMEGSAAGGEQQHNTITIAHAARYDRIPDEITPGHGNHASAADASQIAPSTAAAPATPGEVIAEAPRSDDTRVVPETTSYATPPPLPAPSLPGSADGPSSINTSSDNTTYTTTTTTAVTNIHTDGDVYNNNGDVNNYYTYNGGSNDHCHPCDSGHGTDHDSPDLITTLITNVTQISAGLLAPVTDLADHVVNNSVTQVSTLVGNTVSQVTSLVNEAPGLVSQIVTTADGTVSQVIDTVTNGIPDLLTGVVDSTAGVTHGVVGTVTSLVHEAPGLVSGLLDTTAGAANHAISHVTTLVNDVPNLLLDVLNGTVGTTHGVIDTATTVVADVTGGLVPNLVAMAVDTTHTIISTATDTLNDHLAMPVVTLANDVLSDPLGTAASLPDTTNDVLHSATTLVEDMGGTVGTLVGVVLPGMDTNHPILDANVFALTDQPAAANEYALINLDLGLAGHAVTTPAAADIGLLDVEGSLLSQLQPGSHDGLSLGINAAALTDLVLPETTSLPVLHADIPLPSIQNVPVLQSAPEALPDTTGQVLGNNIVDSLDPILTLHALANTDSLSAVAGAGTLLAGLDTQAALPSEPAPVAPLSSGLHSLAHTLFHA